MSAPRYKIAFVTIRYGKEVVGGAEFLTRLLAEHMAPEHEVTVLTTKATDHVSWKDHYSNDTETLNGVSVLRFSVDQPRQREEMEGIPIFSAKVTLKEEEAWMKAQGPFSTPLLRYIEEHKDDYDFFIFCPYLYATTYFGYQLIPQKTILIPAAHDEPVFYLEMFRTMLQEVRGIICSTPEELALIRRFAENDRVPAAVIGVGLETVQEKPASLSYLKKKFGIQSPYIAYVGRIEPGKGAKDLFQLFDYYRRVRPTPVELVMAGRAIIDVPKRSYLHYLGFVSPEEKYGVLENAVCTINPSRFESLSILLLESWEMKRPVVVNGDCDVLEGQVRRAAAGLAYRDKDEFVEAIDWLVNHPKEASKMGANGSTYLKLNYTWPTILDKMNRFLSSV